MMFDAFWYPWVVEIPGVVIHTACRQTPSTVPAEPAEQPEPSMAELQSQQESEHLKFWSYMFF